MSQMDTGAIFVHHIAVLMIVLVSTSLFSTPALKQHEGTTVLYARRLKTVIGTHAEALG